MSIVPKNSKDTKPTAARRRRKKRRTEDFSDSSDSSSDSSDDSNGSESAGEDEQHLKENTAIEHDKDIQTVDNDGDVVLNDEDIHIPSHETKFDDVKEKLKTVTLTKTALNDRSKNYNTSEVSSVLTRNKKELENGYLGLMFENYGDDMNQLRSAPDFNERSLGILANALKSGSNIFDQDTLRAVVQK